MEDAPLRIIQISDMHLFAEEGRVLLGVNTEESFQAVIDHVQQHMNNKDLIILSGDISQDASESAYIRVADLMKKMNVPVYWVAGNHDDPNIMARIYPYETISNHRHIVLENWHIILLNSHKPKVVEGYLAQSELNYLQHCLQTYPEHYAIIVFHHQPIPVGCRWLDNLWLTNAKEFWQIISLYPQVKTILFGHVHQEFQQQVNGVACYSAPSTCIQFHRKQDEFGLENLPQGYRWIDLYADGHLKTGVERLAVYSGVFDSDAKGY